MSQIPPVAEGSEGPGRVEGCLSAFGRIILVAIGLLLGAIGILAGVLGWFFADGFLLYFLAAVLISLAGYFIFSATVAYQTHGKEVLLEIIGQYLQALINLIIR